MLQSSLRVLKAHQLTGRHRILFGEIERQTTKEEKRKMRGRGWAAAGLHREQDLT